MWKCKYIFRATFTRDEACTLLDAPITVLSCAAHTNFIVPASHTLQITTAPERFRGSSMRTDCWFWLKSTRLPAELTPRIASCPTVQTSPLCAPHLRGMKREE